MKILVLAPALANTSPGQRFRIEQWAKRLESDGFEWAYAPFEDESLHQVLYQRGRLVRKARLMVQALGRRLALLPRVVNYDLVYVFREAALLGPAFIETMIARTNVPVVYDFDDAVWVPYVSPANHYLSYLKCFGKTRALCRMSRHVLAGNQYLADFARKYNRHVTVAPTTIETDVYQVRPPSPREPSRPITIGWTGSYSTVQHLDTLRSALVRLARLRPIRLVVIGTPQYRLEGVDVQAKAWRADSEVADLQQFDIGVMPLPDDEWSRGKCGLKLLQCMGVGVPVVGSPVGVNSDIIQDGVNGCLAATEDEWVRKLTVLIDNHELRETMGQCGRRTVEESYSARVWAPRIGALFTDIVQQSQRSTANATWSRLVRA